MSTGETESCVENPISKMVSTINDHNNETNETIKVLEGRLESVMESPSPTAAEETKKEPTACQLEERLRQVIGEIKDHNTRLRNIINRLQI